MNSSVISSFLDKNEKKFNEDFVEPDSFFKIDSSDL